MLGDRVGDPRGLGGIGRREGDREHRGLTRLLDAQLPEEAVDGQLEHPLGIVRWRRLGAGRGGCLHDRRRRRLRRRGRGHREAGVDQPGCRQPFGDHRQALHEPLVAARQRVQLLVLEQAEVVDHAAREGAQFQELDLGLDHRLVLRLLLDHGLGIDDAAGAGIDRDARDRRVAGRQAIGEQQREAAQQQDGGEDQAAAAAQNLDHLVDVQALVGRRVGG